MSADTAGPVCLLLPLAHQRELVITPEYPGYRLALRRRDGEDVRFEGGFNLARSEVVDIMAALQRLTSNVDRMGLP
jgi:hypothetical protein